MAQAGGATVTYSEGGFLDRFPWYVQLGVLIGFAALIFGAVHYFLLSSRWDDAVKKSQQADELRKQNQEADEIRRYIEGYKQTLDTLNLRLNTLKDQLPEERKVTDIFESAKKQITDNKLKLVSFQTGAKDKEIDKTYYTEVSSTVKVAGSYRQVQALFQSLASYERIVNVTDIALGKAEDKDQAAGSTTVASFTLTAFYISDANRRNLESKDNPAAADPNKKPAPGTPPAPGAPPAAAPEAPAPAK